MSLDVILGLVPRTHSATRAHPLTCALHQRALLKQLTRFMVGPGHKARDDNRGCIGINGSGELFLDQDSSGRGRAMIDRALIPPIVTPAKAGACPGIKCVLNSELARIPAVAGMTASGWGTPERLQRGHTPEAAP